MSKLWTKPEIELLRRHYKKGAKHTQKILARHGYERKTNSIISKAWQLGIYAQNNQWLTTEIAILRHYFPTQSVKGVQIQLELHGYKRTYKAISEKARLLGIKSCKSNRRWTHEDMTVLREYHHKKTRNEIARMLNRTVKGVAHYITKINNDNHNTAAC